MYTYIYIYRYVHTDVYTHIIKSWDPPSSCETHSSVPTAALGTGPAQHTVRPASPQHLLPRDPGDPRLTTIQDTLCISYCRICI